MGILPPEHPFLYFLSPVPISFGYGYSARNEGYAYANISRQSTFWVWVFGYAAGDGLRHVFTEARQYRVGYFLPLSVRRCFFFFFFFVFFSFTNIIRSRVILS